MKKALCVEFYTDALSVILCVVIHTIRHCYEQYLNFSKQFFYLQVDITFVRALLYNDNVGKICALGGPCDDIQHTCLKGTA